MKPDQLYDLLIRGGTVHDPANGVDGLVRDLWIAGGEIVEPPSAPDARARRTIDGRGYVVMPGGVDAHCHIAGSKVNGARGMRPEDHRQAVIARREGLRSGTVGATPSTFATGYLYTGLGYTTALDASIPPLLARQAHHEFADTPLIDKAFLVLMGNNHLLLDFIREGAADRVRDTMAWLLHATKGYGVKIVNPGGVERWKQGKGNVVTLDDPVDGFDVTPRSILTALARAADELALPHPIHLHGLNLGIPGNAATTLETLDALDGHRVHLAHVQFHSYGNEDPRTRLFGSRVVELAERVNRQDGVTLDVGQVMFGETTSMTADGAVGQFLANLTGRKWLSVDVEAETGCGVVPITYDDRNLVHALQWAIGLEWFLSVDDPWKVALSTDHPNGGSFLSYPELIALLMDRGYRADALAKLPGNAREATGLRDLGREYSLNEIAIVTRAAPARMLGLPSKGHLGPGADADVTIYAPDADRARMFALPRWVVKSGEVVVDDGELRASPGGRTLLVAPEFDQDVLPDLKARFERASTVTLRNVIVDASEVSEPRDCTAGDSTRRGGSA
ncbi:MAG: formylmethanofuran dehydrogenase subunit A [Isosphaeraceae bacterium]